MPLGSNEEEGTDQQVDTTFREEMGLSRELPQGKHSQPNPSKMAPPSSSPSTALSFSRLSCFTKMLVLIPSMILIVEKTMFTVTLMDELTVRSGGNDIPDCATAVVDAPLSRNQRHGTSEFPTPVGRPEGQDSSGTIMRDPSRGIRKPLAQLMETDQELQKDCDATKGLSLVSLKPVPDESVLYGVQQPKIPKIIHQTSKSRCVTPMVKSAVEKWRNMSAEYAYYFHSDESIERLLRQDWPEFPHLPQVISCIPKSSGTVLADIWRYVLLWEYGGVYADFDTEPAQFNGKTIQDSDEAFFIVEYYHMLSQYFFAVAPRHPIIFYAIHSTLANLLTVEDISGIKAPWVSGPHALHNALQLFMADKNVTVVKPVKGVEPVRAGIWVGTDSHTLTVRGVASNPNQYVRREAINRTLKLEEYAKMGMQHFTLHSKQSPENRQSCRQQLWQAREYYLQVKSSG